MTGSVCFIYQFIAALEACRVEAAKSVTMAPDHVPPESQSLELSQDIWLGNRSDEPADAAHRRMDWARRLEGASGFERGRRSSLAFESSFPLHRPGIGTTIPDRSYRV